MKQSMTRKNFIGVALATAACGRGVAVGNDVEKDWPPKMVLPDYHAV